MDPYFFVLIGLCVWVAVTSAIAVVVTVQDKATAGRGRRVAESTLLTIAAIGGGLAMYLTMKKIRHKTKKTKFMIGLPVLIFLQIAILIGGTIIYWI
ncbi:MAG: DUF1294 domain-containing protein [Firmicutes bacterium]|nr:DUF1294 domain-containing protein [Bacillota bacterium]